MSDHAAGAEQLTVRVWRGAEAGAFATYRVPQTPTRQAKR